MQVRSVYVSLQRRGAVKRWTGRLPSESPRRERERRDGREREMRRGRARGEEGWLGAAARMGMATYSHGAKTIASRAAGANRRTRSAAAVSARSTSHFDWGLGSTASACASRTRNRGDSGAREGLREVCFCCPSLHTGQCNAIVLPLVLSLSLCPLSTTAPTSRLCAGCSTDTYRIWEAASLEPGMCARTTRMTNVTTPRWTGAHCLQTVPTFEAWTDQSK